MLQMPETLMDLLHPFGTEEEEADEKQIREEHVESCSAQPAAAEPTLTS